MNRDHRVLFALALNATLCFLLSEVNSALSRTSLHLTLDALYLLFAVLYFRVHHGLIVVIISALAVDSLIQIPFGQSIFVYSFAYLIALRMRFGMRRENYYHVMIIALTANAAIYVANTLAAMGEGFPGSPYWIRCTSDFLLSELLIALIAGLYVRFQKNLFSHVGIDLASELQLL